MWMTWKRPLWLIILIFEAIFLQNRDFIYLLLMTTVCYNIKIHVENLLHVIILKKKEVGWQDGAQVEGLAPLSSALHVRTEDTY